MFILQFRNSFWPDSFWMDTARPRYNDVFFNDVNALWMPVEDINWNDPESQNLKISSHIKVLMKVMKIIDSIRHAKVYSIEDTTTPLKDLLLDFCDLWKEYIVFSTTPPKKLL